MKKLYKSMFVALMSVATFFTASAAVSEWCDTPWGHLQDPNFGDPAGRILLTITNAGTNQVQVTIKPAPSSPKSGFNYIQVSGACLVSTVTVGKIDSDDPDQPELSATLEVKDGTTDMGTLNLYWSYAGWGGQWATSVENADATATCGGGCELTELPTITSATVSTIDVSSVVISVVGKDQKGDDVTKFIVNGNTYSATDGKITVNGLTPSTHYSFDIYAKDACGNVSAAAKNVEFDTESRTVECSGKKGHFAVPAEVKINYTIAEEGDNVIYTITPISGLFNEPVETNPAAVLFVDGAGYNMKVADDLTSASYTINGVAAASTHYVAFQYSLEGMGGMEMTANPTNDPTTAIYFVKGECASASINETKSSNVVIYPNPVADILNVEATSVIEKVDVVSISGAVVVTETPDSEAVTINISNLAAGRYVVVVTTNGISESKKILVK